MKKWLISWIGETDHRAAEGGLTQGAGPIAAALASEHYDRVYLLTNYPRERSTPVLQLAQHSDIPASSYRRSRWLVQSITLRSIGK